MKNSIANTALVIAIALTGAGASAQGVDGIQQPLQLIEDVCVRASLAVNEAQAGVDMDQRIRALRQDEESIRTEMLQRLEATEIERGLRVTAQGDAWDANREASACLERNRHVALAYVTAE